MLHVLFLLQYTEKTSNFENKHRQKYGISDIFNMKPLNFMHTGFHTWLQFYITDVDK